MPSFVNLWSAGLRRVLPKSRQSWRELAAGTVLLAGFGGMTLWGSRLNIAAQVVAWAFLVMTLAWLLRGGWVKLFGPVLLYDMVCTARRGRYALLRTSYAACLLLMLLSILVKYGEDLEFGSMPPGELARFAESFFSRFMEVQLLAVLLLTPAYTAGAIADEKERKTLEFLLATDLRNREIVLSKVVSRLANLALLVLTGLPVLSLTQFWGGVDPNLVLAGFAATGLTMASLAGLSILASVLARKPREAMILTYLAVVAYLAVSLMSRAILAYPKLAGFQLISGQDPVTIGSLVEWFSAGNLPVVLYKLRDALDKNLTLSSVLPGLVRDYAWFHGLAAVICTLWAIARLRVLALKQFHAKAVRRIRSWSWLRPRVGRNPMIWKEVVAEPGMMFNWFGRALVLVIVLVSFGPILWIGISFLTEDPFRSNSSLVVGGKPGSWFNPSSLREFVNLWIRIVGTLVACLTLLGVAIRAATSVSGERARQTLDSLLITRLKPSTILYAKWLGSILSVRWAALWLAVIWALGLMTGGLHPSTVPWLILCWFVYAGFLSALGLFFSAIHRTTLRATLWTLIVTAIAWVGHWLPWMVGLISLGSGSGLERKDMEGWLSFQSYGLTPPLALSWFAFTSDDLRLVFMDESWHVSPWDRFLAIVEGLFFWSAAAAVLWWMALGNFIALSVRRPSVGKPYLLRRLFLRTDSKLLGDTIPPNTAAQRKKWRRRLVGLGLVLAAVCAGWYGISWYAAEQELQEAFAEADRLDPGWRWADLEAKRSLVPANVNSAPRVMALARGQLELEGSMNDPTRPSVVLRRLAFDESNLRKPLPGFSPDDIWHIYRVMDQLAPIVIEARRLAEFPLGQYPPPILFPKSWTFQLDHFEDLQPVRMLLWLDIIRRLQDNDPEGALVSCRAMMNVGRSVGDAPFASPQMERAKTASYACSGLELILAQGALSDRSLAQIQELLQLECTHNYLLTVARGERAYTDDLIDAFQRGDYRLTPRWKEVHGLKEVGADKAWRDQANRLLQPGYMKRDRAQVLKIMNRVVEIAKLPPHEQPSKLGEWKASIREQPESVQLLMTNCTINAGTPTPFQECLADMRCALVAVAIERYRLANQRWPNSLTDLKELLLEIPTDPADGRPLCYARFLDGVVVYSGGTVAQVDGSFITQFDSNVPHFRLRWRTEQQGPVKKP